MIMFDKKKALMTIIAKRHPKDGTMSAAPMKTEVTKEDDGQLDGRHAAAEDMIAAFHEKSPQKLMEAMANFHDLHSQMSNKSTEEPDGIE